VPVVVDLVAMTQPLLQLGQQQVVDTVQGKGRSYNTAHCDRTTMTTSMTAVTALTAVKTAVTSKE